MIIDSVPLQTSIEVLMSWHGSKPLIFMENKITSMTKNTTKTIDKDDDHFNAEFMLSL